jgi:hypothetical protein
MLSGPHADKEGLEYLFQRAGSGFPAPKAADTPPEAILSAAERDGAPENTIPEFTIVRPALLTDGAAAGPPTLKAAEGLATYTCSRRDVADFITRECLPGSDAWVNKCPILGY